MRLLLPLLMSSLGFVACAQPDDERVVSAVLDDFHEAASRADGPRYFGHFADNGIFLGTDSTERWTVDQFKAYANPYFDAGTGWTYTPTERHVYFAPGGNTAFFDERLTNETYGECRGSGALVRSDGVWKIAQYNLTIPIPNAIAREVVDRIKASQQE